MKKRKELRDPYHMFIGNLLIFDKGIGRVSDINYVVIREKKHVFAEPQYYAFPGGFEVLVEMDSEDITSKDNQMPILINAERLHEAPHERKIDSTEVKDIFIRNNDVKKVKQLAINNQLLPMNKK